MFALKKKLLVIIGLQGTMSCYEFAVYIKTCKIETCSEHVQFSVLKSLKTVARLSSFAHHPQSSQDCRPFLWCNAPYVEQERRQAQECWETSDSTLTQGTIASVYIYVALVFLLHLFLRPLTTDKHAKSVEETSHSPSFSSSDCLRLGSSGPGAVDGRAFFALSLLQRQLEHPVRYPMQWIMRLWTPLTPTFFGRRAVFDKRQLDVLSEASFDTLWTNLLRNRPSLLQHLNRCFKSQALGCDADAVWLNTENMNYWEPQRIRTKSSWNPARSTCQRAEMDKL